MWRCAWRWRGGVRRDTCACACACEGRRLSVGTRRPRRARRQLSPCERERRAVHLHLHVAVSLPREHGSPRREHPTLWVPVPSRQAGVKRTLLEPPRRPCVSVLWVYDKTGEHSDSRYIEANRGTVTGADISQRATRITHTCTHRRRRAHAREVVARAARAARLRPSTDITKCRECHPRMRGHSVSPECSPRACQASHSTGREPRAQYLSHGGRSSYSSRKPCSSLAGRAICGGGARFSRSGHFHV